jgi:hypothetical protein
VILDKNAKEKFIKKLKKGDIGFLSRNLQVSKKS